VLPDRWPAARAITRNPELVGDLEEAAGQEDAFAETCARHTPPPARDLTRLRRFFNTGPQAGPVAEHLVDLGADQRTPEGGARG
jgi:hypothetical protein